MAHSFGKEGFKEHPPRSALSGGCKGLTLKCTAPTMASAAAAWPAKDYEIPRLGTTGKLEDSHSGVLAGSETGLLLQAGRQ